MDHVSVIDLHYLAHKTDELESDSTAVESAVGQGPLLSFQKPALLCLAAQKWQSSGNPQGRAAVHEGFSPALAVTLSRDGRWVAPAPIYPERRTMAAVRQAHVSLGSE